MRLLNSTSGGSQSFPVTPDLIRGPARRRPKVGIPDQGRGDEAGRIARRLSDKPLPRRIYFPAARRRAAPARAIVIEATCRSLRTVTALASERHRITLVAASRSEERRGGKACVSTGRSRW